MAIDSAAHKHAWYARRWTWDRRTPWGSLGAGALLGLVLFGGASGCSKGGAPDLNGCPKLSDPLPGDDSAPPLRTNYVVLKSASGALITAKLDGVSGSYAANHVFTQCDQQELYTVDKIVLVNKQGDPVATAANTGSGVYSVTYANGLKTSASGMGFTMLSSSFADSTATPAVTLQALTANAMTTLMANQGDPITVQATMMGNPCAIRDSQWWLTTASVGTPPITAMQPIAGGSGSVTLRVPPTAMPGVYYLAGQVTLSSGRILQVQRVTATDPNYTLVDAKGMPYPIMPPVPVVSITVDAKADVDKTAPQAVGVAVSPVAPVRCGMANLTLHIKDDQPLPAGQQVKVWLGQANQPKITSLMVVGSEYLSGALQLPLDAPAGVWYAWPQVIRDAVGNEATATFNADGTFSLTGQDAMAKPVPAATFTLASSSFELPDAATPGVDMAGPVDLGGAPDMATPLPAVLFSVNVTPSKIDKIGEPVNIYVSWTDNTANLQ